MDAILKQKKEIILHAFEKTPGSYWKTLSEIASFSKVQLEDVIKIVFSQPEFMKAKHVAEDGQPLFTTWDVYFAKTPWWRQIVHGFLKMY